MDSWRELAIIGEVALAMLLGGLIGIEREIADKPAGFRTHMLVAGAAALLVGLGGAMLNSFVDHGRAEFIRSDPIRIVEAIITGIAFLGAGTIFRRQHGEHVEGLTTAASILFSAAIGIAVALREFTIAIGVTVLALIALRGLKIVHVWIDRRRERQEP